MSGAPSERPNLVSRLDGGDIFRIVRDIFVDELGRSRGDAFDSLWATSWTMETSVRSGGADLDSLERFTLASRLNETFSLHESGVEDNLLRAHTLGDTVEVILAGLSHYAGSVTFFSGGTTGTPRPRRHRTEHLAQEIRFLATLFRDRRRVLVTVPVHHIYGFLFGVLLPQELDLPVVEARGSFLSGPRAPEPGDLVISVPFLWERFVPAVPGWGRDIQGVSSTAPLSSALCSRLHEGGMASLVEVYGSSETAGVAWRDCCAGEEAFRLFPYWSFDAADPAVLVRQEPSGAGTSRWELPDRVILQDDGRIRPAGRRDDVVQVGGNNVDLHELRSRIREVLDAADCALRPATNGRIKAFLVFRHSRENLPTPADIRSTLRKVLPDYAVPASITVGSQVPRDETGKLLDW
jgi:long-chain acyl-CoA synthetase